ncbi:hypothetical protein [Pseudomonas veronii]|uniref:hypothetical protein n=1 Tax=Pseudomonas veronii TaxID=76761 RepID=UPI00126013FD|nr:hypothetical protein [Pseudomonas veronii]
MSEQNSTFRRGNPTWANACVGDNGQPDYIDYAKGFSTAANTLILSVLSTRGLKFSPDHLIYPICFNMRHSVELHLKGTANYLLKFSLTFPPKLEFNLSSSHDIGIIWEFIKENSVRIDPRYSIITNKLDATISDIASIDPTGQTFRYAINKENKKHLTDVSLINVQILHNKFSTLEKHLTDLNRLNEQLEEEFRYGDRTSKLSRHDLFLISKTLPKKTEWGSKEFIVTKEKIRQTFNLSSNDFSRALVCIRENYLMASIIGAPLPLRFATKECLVLFFDAWDIANDIEKYRNAFLDDNVDIDESLTSYKNVLENLFEDNENELAALTKIKKSINTNQLIDIETLYRLTQDSHYPERYPNLYEIYESHSVVDDIEEGSIAYRLLGLIRAPEQIIKSLFFLGQTETAEILLAHYELENCFDWIERARSGELFKAPWTWAFSEEETSNWDKQRIYL